MPVLRVVTKYDTKLGKEESLGITLPKQLVRSHRLKSGDVFDIEVKSIEPLILALVKRRKIEY